MLYISFENTAKLSSKIVFFLKVTQISNKYCFYNSMYDNVKIFMGNGLMGSKFIYLSSGLST